MPINKKIVFYFKYRFAKKLRNCGAEKIFGLVVAR